MIQNYSRWQVLRIFFDEPNPREGFMIRSMAKQINLAPTSVKLHINILIGQGLVIKSEGIPYQKYWPNREHPLFRFYKRIDMQLRLEESKLLEYLSEECSSQVIILFGSTSRGEDDQMSDVDLFILAKEKKLKLEKYENHLKRKIQLHFSQDFHKLPKELKNNIMNGIIVRGYMKVF